MAKSPLDAALKVPAGRLPAPDISKLILMQANCPVVENQCTDLIATLQTGRPTTKRALLIADLEAHCLLAKQLAASLTEIINGARVWDLSDAKMNLQFLDNVRHIRDSYLEVIR